MKTAECKQHIFKTFTSAPYFLSMLSSHFLNQENFLRIQEFLFKDISKIKAVDKFVKKESFYL